MRMVLYVRRRIKLIQVDEYILRLRTCYPRVQQERRVVAAIYVEVAFRRVFFFPDLLGILQDFQVFSDSHSFSSQTDERQIPPSAVVFIHVIPEAAAVLIIQLIDIHKLLKIKTLAVRGLGDQALEFVRQPRMIAGNLIRMPDNAQEGLVIVLHYAGLSVR